MKKYFLFLTLLVLTLFSPGIVKADETNYPLDGMGLSNSCTDNLLKFVPYTSGEYNTYSNSFISNTSSWPQVNNTYWINTNFILYDSSLNYYIYVFDLDNNIVTTYDYVSRIYLYYFDENFKNVSSSDSTAKYILPLFSWSSSTQRKFSYFLEFYNNYKLVVSTKELDSYVEYSETCSTLDPVDPNNPKPQETNQAKILQNFYILFLDRLKFISEYAIINYLFLAFIGIILVFVILEIFLYLYNKGGYK